MPASRRISRPRSTRSTVRSKPSRGESARTGSRWTDSLRFIDEGQSGAVLVRPALERLRDQAAAGLIDRLYVHSPDRLARKYAYQILLVEEFQRCGIEVVFLNHEIGDKPEEQLLLQVQGMIAEYERAKILERSRRGKMHAARNGSVSVFGKAPYGYRYVSKRDGHGVARFEVIASEARTVVTIFEWYGKGDHSLIQICERLNRRGGPEAEREAGVGPHVGLGHAQGYRLQGRGALRQIPRRRVQAAPATRPRAARVPAPSPFGHDDTGRRTDPDPGPGDRARGPVRGRAGEAGGEQGPAPAERTRRAVPAPGADGVREVWICLYRQNPDEA